MGLLEETLAEIKPAYEDVKQRSKVKWDKLGKPLGSLGKLELIGIKIAGMTGKLSNTTAKKAVVVMAGDNGIYDEDVASSPKPFTKILVENTAGGLTGVATLSRYVNADVKVVDLGVDAEIEHEDVIRRKIAYGTNNFTKGPAMSYEDCVKAIEVGIEVGDSLYQSGYDILGVGELGVGNTTTSSAILTALTGLTPEVTCGLGAGLLPEQFENKKRVILEGIEVNKPNPDDAIDVMAKIGGFDIAGMCGVYLSAAKNRKPVVIDGFISSAAALCAARIKSEVKDFLLPSHLSKEPAAERMLKELDLDALVNLDMRLGEGSGCPIAFQIIDTALFVEDNMGTFDELKIDSSILLDMREKSK